MMGLDVPWAIDQLKSFLHTSRDDGMYQAEADAVIAAQAHVAEQILDRLLPEWRAADPRSQELRFQAPWAHLRPWASRGIAALEREEELREKLGDDAPSISASSLHPWVWSGARSLWQSRHYRSAVADAAKKVNAETQNKVERRDVSETNLFRESFSPDPPVPGRPRLRRMPDDGSDTYRSVQRGAMALAEGIYAGIRNPFNHEDLRDIGAQVGLEYLAALSVLARWVDESTLETS